ncbi:MAG: IPT/TIG domain-containing protein [Reichenbachiella sp.]|uniref:IPT/TIG domain-containing protein n=1 Tax=Reichenbachiella sp. TaxID=2184521 RepID=UPI0029660CF0|nr:IPT/TIG domain-containing protein [Reichenbachiella sp.]MDW3212017.1 IPT/TIG domain-containing protein [Reichenbachiella sp.]
MNKNYNLLRKLQRSLMVATMVALGSLAVSCGDDEEDQDDNIAPIPTITSISPDSAEPGDDITITGTDLSDATSVTFNEVAAAAIVSNTATEIVATLPENASTGKVSVATAGGLAISEGDLTVIVIGAAVVESIEPISAQVGENIVITGIDMETVSSVKIGDVDATVVSTTATTAEVTVGEGTTYGAKTLTIVNEGGSTTTSVETTKFYVIQMIDEIYQETFDSENPDVIGMTGSADGEESTVHGVSTEVSEEATDLPPAIDGAFFHMEGFSSMEYSTSYMAQLGLRTQDVGTFADFFGDAIAAEDVYFNIQINFGELPEGYATSEDAADILVGLRIRFETDDYEWTPTMKEIHDLGFEADENGWYNLSVPATLFDDDAAIGTFAFKDMKRYAVAQRRNYGAGTALPLSTAGGGVHATLSFDNVSISLGGPLSY